MFGACAPRGPRQRRSGDRGRGGGGRHRGTGAHPMRELVQLEGFPRVGITPLLFLLICAEEGSPQERQAATVGGWGQRQRAPTRRQPWVRSSPRGKQ